MKTQIRICLTVEFKAYFLIFRSAAARETPLALVQTRLPDAKADESLPQLDASYEGRVLMPMGLFVPNNRPASVK
jgi:hypothetical protein